MMVQLMLRETIQTEYRLANKNIFTWNATQKPNENAGETATQGDKSLNKRLSGPADKNLAFYDLSNHLEALHTFSRLCTHEFRSHSSNVTPVPAIILNLHTRPQSFTCDLLQFNISNLSSTGQPNGKLTLRNSTVIFWPATFNAVVSETELRLKRTTTSQNLSYSYCSDRVTAEENDAQPKPFYTWDAIELRLKRTTSSQNLFTDVIFISATDLSEATKKPSQVGAVGWTADLTPTSATRGLDPLSLSLPQPSVKVLKSVVLFLFLLKH